MKTSREEENEHGEVRTIYDTPEPSLLPLKVLKEKAPLKLLNFYEERYF
tara:strand:+ start:439 stop:585 length:147 start_codon:yes stop_codon:yes gene_type:complete